MRPAIILFAKAPWPGRVKTRLQPLLSPKQAAELHACFVRDMLETLGRNFAGQADIALHTDIPTDAWSDLPVASALQSEGDLGRRMWHALQLALDSGHPQALIVGSDAPTLPPGHLQALLSSPADLALGPSEDGGYYAVACRRVHPDMFHGVRWSGPDALRDTLAAARRCGLTLETGPTWFDVDEPADLFRLAASPTLPLHTAACLRRNGFDTASQ